MTQPIQTLETNVAYDDNAQNFTKQLHKKGYINHNQNI